MPEGGDGSRGGPGSELHLPRGLLRWTGHYLLGWLSSHGGRKESGTMCPAWATSSGPHLLSEETGPEGRPKVASRPETGLCGRKTGMRCLEGALSPGR